MTFETTSYRVMPRILVEVAAFAPKAVVARLSEDFPDVLQEFRLEAVITEVDAQGTGTVDHHPDDLEDEGNRRGKITMR